MTALLSCWDEQSISLLLTNSKRTEGFLSIKIAPRPPQNLTLTIRKLNIILEVKTTWNTLLVMVIKE